MRLLKTFEDKILAEKFSSFLKKEGIENNCEIIANTDWGSSDYGTFKCHIWVIDEDQFSIAQRWLGEFDTHPNNLIFSSSTPSLVEKLPVFNDKLSKEREGHNRKHPLKKMTAQATYTVYVFLLCIFLFIIGKITTPTYETHLENVPLLPLFYPTINKVLMYDYPQSYQWMDKFVKIYGLEGLQNYESLPPEGLFLLKKIQQTPIWPGFYSLAVAYFIHPEQPIKINSTLFGKIREGQFWRIFTPCLLHANELHLFLNMLWLVYIGKLIEERLGGLRYLLLIFFTAIAANTAQYLMSGSNFLGFSGVLCGMFAFAWARHKYAPWEGYRLAPGTFTFLFVSIMAMVFIQFVSFFLNIQYHLNEFPTIANTAHVIGGITGYLLGRFSLMSAKN